MNRIAGRYLVIAAAALISPSAAIGNDSPAGVDQESAHVFTFDPTGCPLTCDPGAIIENEPDCGAASNGGDGTDSVNGGCSWPPCPGCPLDLFSPIACGDSYCGSFGADGGIRDSDWHLLEPAVPTGITATLRTGDTAASLQLWDLADVGGPCDSIALLVGQTAPACGGQVTINRCLNPGRYALRVTSNAVFFGIPCGAEYNLYMECGPCLGACLDINGCTCTDDVADTDCIGPAEQWSNGRCCAIECGTPPGGYASSGVTLLSQTDLSQFPDNQNIGAAVTHYVSPAGQEYGIMTFSKGTGFVRVTGPGSPEVVGYTDGEGIEGIHREVQTYGEYAYIVTDDGPGVGLQVVDLTGIDGNVVTRVNTTGLGAGFQTAHTLFANRDSGYLYLNSSNITGREGLVALDLSADPVEPPIVGTWIDVVPNVDCHDSQVVSYTSGPYAGREIAFCFAENNGLYIVDVTDKANMFTLSSEIYPNVTYTHQGWLSEDRQYLFINDEADEFNGVVPQTLSYIINVADLSNPFYVSAFSPGGCATDHNEMVRGDFLFEANYTTGLQIFSICNINNVQKIGYFDTHPENNAVGFDGMWGVDTRLPSGVVICSDRQRGLFVFDVTAALASVNPAACGLFGDIAPPGGDGIVDLNDILCVLDGFANQLNCPDADLIPCGGGGDGIDLNDILAVLDAFSADYACPP